MKLDKKIKDRIDKYFNEISGLEFVNLLKHKYGFELDLEVSEGISFVNKSFEKSSCVTCNFLQKTYYVSCYIIKSAKDFFRNLRRIRAKIIW